MKRIVNCEGNCKPDDSISVSLSDLIAKLYVFFWPREYEFFTASPWAWDLKAFFGGDLPAIGLGAESYTASTPIVLRIS